MKKNNKGFTLIETLVVSSFIVGILIFLFSQFSKLKTSYEASFEYNTIPALYKAKNINRYINTSGSSILRSFVDTNPNGFVDITACPESYLDKTDFCIELLDRLGAVSVVVVKESTYKDKFQSYLKNNPDSYHQKLYTFVKQLSTRQDNFNGYRIIAEFENDNFASVKLTY